MLVVQRLLGEGPAGSTKREPFKATSQGLACPNMFASDMASRKESRLDCTKPRLLTEPTCWRGRGVGN